MHLLKQGRELLLPAPPRPERGANELRGCAGLRPAQSACIMRAPARQAAGAPGCSPRGPRSRTRDASQKCGRLARQASMRPVRARGARGAGRGARGPARTAVKPVRQISMQSKYYT